MPRGSIPRPLGRIKFHAPLLAAGLLTFGGFYHYFDAQQSERLRMELEMIASGVEKSGTEYLERTDLGDCRVTLIDPEGEVVYDTAADAEKLENHGQREEVRDAIEKGTGHSVRYSATLTEKTSYYAKRLQDGRVIRISRTGITLGAIVIEMQPDRVYGQCDP